MATFSFVFRVPIVDLTLGDGPFQCIKARDDGAPESRRRPCGHRHRGKQAATKCARSLCLGQTFGAVNQRVEIEDLA